MLARSVLITGCSRGLGLELTRQLAPQTEIVIATARKPDEALELTSLALIHKNINILPLDVLQHDKFEEVVQQVSLLLGGAGLNVLVNNAGIDPEASLTESFYTEDMLETYAVNAISPAQLTKVFLPLLKLGATSCKGDFYLKKSLIINMSSRHGSITNSDSALELPYKCSKAALNMLTKCLSHDLKQFGISVISMHPGWVQTDMGGPNASLTKEESISTMIDTIQKLNHEHSGQFLNWKGEKLPW